MKHLPVVNYNSLTDLTIPSFEHKEPEDDDCGLPENPIFTNYSKYLWKGHSENPNIRRVAGPTKKFDGNKKLK